MKLYTLEYDCNKPAVQQINVPTNTDYKVGIKVTKNGTEQNLKPAEVKLYTGNSTDYISPNAELTNGYMTFTRSTEDEAFAEADLIDIQHGYEAGYSHPAYAEQNNTGAALAVVLISADLSDFVGKTIYPEDVYYSGIANTRAELTLSALEEDFGPYWRDNDKQSTLDWKTLIEDKDGNVKIYMVVSGAIRDNYITYLNWPKDKPGFFMPNPNDPTQMWIADSYTVQEGDRLAFGKGYNVSNTRWYGGKLSITAGEPFDATFKLTTNTFKSQQGDLADDISTGKTTTLSGEYADGTDFNYNIVVA